MPRPGAWLVAALGVALLACAPARAEKTTIFKCLDNQLGLVYTDLPCKDGEKLNIRTGDSDPAAVARLERSLDQLDQSAAERMRDERRAADMRLAMGSPPEADEDRGAAAAYSPLDYGYLAYPRYLRPRSHPLRPHRPQQLKHAFAPSPPYIVPRH